MRSRGACRALRSLLGVSEQVRHPIFARLYARLAKRKDPREEEHRRELLDGLTGRVVEVGAGSGLNFAHYPAEVVEVVAVEPESYLRSVAEEVAAEAPVKVTVVAGVAGALPLEDASVDAGVASLVLCSVSDQAAALGELQRVIRPGGELRFYEHVVAEDPKTRRAQRRVSRIWPHLGGGCHVDRDTVGAIEAAGFVMERVHRFDFVPGPLLTPVRPHVLGVARRPQR